MLQRLTPEQKDAVKSMGFGGLLGLRCRTLRRSLCLWLLERFNTSRRSLEICGKCIPLSPRDVEHVMGLTASGKDVVNSGPDDLIADLRHHYNATNRGISVRLLEDHLAAPEAGEDFKRSFVLYALGTVLSPTARLDVSPSFLHFLTNMDVLHQYNWGKFLLERLVREISRFRQGRQQAVGGCLLFLQVNISVSFFLFLVVTYSYASESISELLLLLSCFIMIASPLRELVLYRLLLFRVYLHGVRKRSLREKSEKENLVVMVLGRYNYIYIL